MPSCIHISNRSALPQNDVRRESPERETHTLAPHIVQEDPAYTVMPDGYQPDARTGPSCLENPSTRTILYSDSTKCIGSKRSKCSISWVATTN